MILRPRTTEPTLHSTFIGGSRQTSNASCSPTCTFNYFGYYIGEYAIHVDVGVPDDALTTLSNLSGATRHS